MKREVKKRNEANSAEREEGDRKREKKIQLSASENEIQRKNSIWKRKTIVEVRGDKERERESSGKTIVKVPCARSPFHFIPSPPSTPFLLLFSPT